MAKATHAGLPWLRFIRQKLGDHVHFWPFDGWDIPSGRSAIAEVYPALWNQDFASDELTRDQQDAFSIAAFLSRADADGSLIGLLAPELTEEERKLAEIEGWISVRPAPPPKAGPRPSPPGRGQRHASTAGKGPIVPGYTNLHGQTVLRRAYVLGCQWCGLQYEANRRRHPADPLSELPQPRARARPLIGRREPARLSGRGGAVSAALLEPRLREDRRVLLAQLGDDVVDGHVRVALEVYIVFQTELMPVGIARC